MQATRTYIEALTTALAGENKLKFKEGQGWHTDIGKKIITYDMQTLLDLDVEFVKGLLLHELGHILYTKPTKRKLQEQYPELQDIYNSFEDIRLEGLTIQKYNDFARVPFINLQFVFGEENLRKAQTQGLKQQSLINQYSLAVLNKMALHSNYYKLNYENNFYDHQNNIDSFIKLCDKRVQEALNKSEQAYDFTTLVRLTHKFTNTTELQDFIDKNIFPIIKDLFNKNAKQDRKAMEMVKKAIGTLQPKDKPKVESFASDNEIQTAYSPIINTLASKLNAILQEQKATRFTGNHLAGKLLSNNAYKVFTADTRIFSRKLNPNKPDYHIYFLLDESGSMADAHSIKLKNAYTGSFILSAVCKKLGFKQDFFSFDYSTRKLSTLAEYRNIKCGGTNLYLGLEAIKKALDPKDNNLVFLLTDGEFDNDSVQDIIIKIEKQAKLFGIGLKLSDNGKQSMLKVFKNVVIVDNPETLSSEFLRIIKQVIHR